MKNTAIQFIKFGIIGAINSVLSVGLYTFFKTIGFTYVISNAFAWFITVVISFILNSCFVFNKSDNRGQSKIKAFLKVLASYAITGLCLNTFLLFFWIDILHIPTWVAATFPWIGEWNLPFQIPDTIPAILNIAISTPINFVLNKFWAYRKGGN